MPRKSASYRIWSGLSALLLLMGLFVSSASPVVAQEAPAPSANRNATGTYTNPLSIQIPGDGKVESCADPSIIRGQKPGDSAWYIYCTTDPLNGSDKNTSGGFNFHLIPTLKSYDLVNWTYVGDVFATRPDWLLPTSGIWAPDIHFFNGKYYLYYTAPDTKAGGSAIGVALSDSPTGPWTDSGGPVVEPHAADCCPGSRRWVFDPAVIEYQGQKYIFYGSYFGGISARKLSADGLHSDPSSQVAITIANRYEGAFIYQHDGYFYLFASATDCCRGPLTGYSVFAGRSQNPLGPYLDREGVSLLAGRVGGTPVISMNGNRWVGPGHNAIFHDFDGQDWFVYHAVDRTDPYFAGTAGTSNFTKRPVLLDPLDWIEGWPTVRAGRWASDNPVQAPAAQPGQKTNYKPKPPKPDVPGDLLDRFTDEFDETIGRQWTWVRQPAAGTYGIDEQSFFFKTQANKDLFEGSNNASVLTEPAPKGNYVVETRVKLDVPPEGCCYNFVQAGLVIYGDDDNFIKLAHVSIFETRQTEFAKETTEFPAGYPRYGNTVVGPPDEWTYLRIVKETRNGQEYYTAYTSRDDNEWVKGGTWTHQLGDKARIGLVAMGGGGFTANFDYVRVYRLEHE